VSGGAAVTDEIRIEGLSELRDTLINKLPEALRGRATQGALAKAAAPIIRAARALAPVDTGVLRRAIYSFRNRQSTRTYESRLISVRRGKRHAKTNRDAFYWKFVEFGHLTRRTKEGPPTFVPPRPFMRPAFEAQKLNALRIFQEQLRVQIEKVAQRAQSRSLTRLGSALRRGLSGF
jgi:HK97 gp10 family phage protein